MNATISIARQPRYQIPALVLLGLVAYAPSLKVGFASDDFFHIRAKGPAEILS